MGKSVCGTCMLPIDEYGCGCETADLEAETDALRAEVERLRGVMVKPLVWGGQGTWENQPSYHADSSMGWLMIVDHRQHGNGFRVYSPWEETPRQYPTLEAAKAAAQADYAERILSALAPAGDA